MGENEKQPAHEEQLKTLYLDQKHTLNLFLERGPSLRRSTTNHSVI